MTNIDPRIGTLNSGIYYAFINGPHEPEFRGTLEEVEIALGVRAAPAAPAKQAFKTYSVHVRFQFPAWCYKDGITYDGMIGRTKAEAIKRAREQADLDGHLGAGQGLVWFKATEEEA